MKIDVEITEDEIKEAIELRVKEAVRKLCDGYVFDNYVKERVKAGWKAAVDALVDEALSDSDAIRAKIAEELIRKLRAQMGAAIKIANA